MEIWTTKMGREKKGSKESAHDGSEVYWELSRELGHPCYILAPSDHVLRT